MKKRKLFLVIVVLAGAILACSNFSFDRTSDGDLRVESSLSLDLIQTVLETSANFDQVVGLELEPRDGYIFVQADALEFQGTTGTNVSFHLEMSSSNGDLVAAVTNVQSGNDAFDTIQFESLNEQLGDMLTEANGLEDITNFESVSITPEGVFLIVIIEMDSSN